MLALQPKAIQLFVIETQCSTGPAYWSCSPEHGSGWHPGEPKQAFTKSELAKEIFRLVDQGIWQDCTIRRLAIRHPG